MAKNILVAYASVSGSTGEVAAAIGEVLRQEPTVTVKVSHVRAIKTVEPYSAVVLGSSIRAGRWLPEAFKFLEAHQNQLQQVPVAYFTTCLTMVTDNADSRRTVLGYMQPVRQAVPDITPVGLGLFAGALDPSRAPIMPSEHTPQGDYRNWSIIRAWAKEIRPLLLQGPARSSTQNSQDLDEAVTLPKTVLGYSDMSTIGLSQADLVRVDLTEADNNENNEVQLDEIDLSGSDLAKFNSQKIELHQANLSWAELQSADMREADLSQANLIGAHLDRADLRQANLKQAILNGANLSYANLSQADLSHADLNWADLRGAELSRANLSYASLGWANLSNANLSQINLTQARYNDYTQWPPDFSPEDHGGLIIRSEPH